MSGFKIRGIFNPDEDDYLTYVGIDNFDKVLTFPVENEEYYFAASILDEDGNILPKDKQHSEFGSQSSFQEDINEGINVVFDDVYSLPTPSMYLALGEILRERGMVFNKKKSRFQVIKKGETT